MGPEHGHGARPKIRSALERHPHLGRDLDVAASLNLTAEQFYGLPEDEREWWIERHEMEQDRHEACGHPREVCSDPTILWYPQRSICYATREKEAALAKFHSLHAAETGRVWHNGTESSWSRDRDDDHPYHYMHGTAVWVARRDVNPDDDFLSVAGGFASSEDEPDPAEGDERG